jgi:putative MATE family efflux protein
MARAAPTATLPLEYAPPSRAWTGRSLLRELVWLSVPAAVENALHIFVGVTDVYLAGHLKHDAEAATAAVGAVAYVLWLVSLMGGAIGAGSTAIIARAVGARHRSLANSVCGQSVGAAALTGAVAAALCAIFAAPLARFTGLQGVAEGFTFYYFRVLTLCLPFMLITVAAGACLRAAGDTLSPAVAMIVVDGVNMFASFALTRGWFGLPEMGFRGIAVGTVLAYIAGGFILVAVLLRGSRVKLYLHRLRPHWQTMRRILRIGLPTAMELFPWLAQFAIVIIINYIDRTNVSAAAHIITIRVESFSFMGGLAVATAAATMVGQSLGMRDPARARHSTYLAYALAAAYMVTCSIVFIVAGGRLAGWMTTRPEVIALSARCLFVTAFAQPAFAAALAFGGALRGAGDTLVMMTINLTSTIGLRLTGVVLVTLVLHHGLVAIWVVLASELTLRGTFIVLRFLHGGWRHVEV